MVNIRLQSSTFGVGLFYLAGLLPDPDETYTVNLVNRNMWIMSAFYEIAWLAHGWTVLTTNSNAGNVWHTALAVVAVVRVLVLLCMSVLFVGIYHWRSWGQSSPDGGERQNLIGDGSPTYGTTNYSNGSIGAKASSPKRAGDAQTTTWLDYVIGFKSLFPFLW